MQKTSRQGKIAGGDLSRTAASVARPREPRTPKTRKAAVTYSFVFKPTEQQTYDDRRRQAEALRIALKIGGV